MPETMLTLPLASVDVSVERSSESLKLAEIAKSKLRFGAASNSTSNPRVLAPWAR